MRKMPTGCEKTTTFFDLSIDAQHKAMEDRDLSTETRVTQGNILWDEITRFCSIGKTLYEDEDPAKYNDYVLTQSASQPTTAATPTT